MKEFGNVEYKMSKTCADNLLKMRKGEEKTWPAQKFLCEYVNLVYGVRGHCTHVIIEND
jgi:hypothetical protein